MQSDLVLDPEVFAPRNVTKSTLEVCGSIRRNDDATASAFGDAVKMRQFAAPPSEPGEYFDIPSRDAGRQINCRVARPSAAADSSPNGVFLHLHGGGLAVGTHDMNDPYMQRLANASGCILLSANYRLAPEHPWPSGGQDCFDVVDYLIKNGSKEFGGPLRFIGGESAGAYLTLQTYFHVAGTYPAFNELKGLVMNYGCFSWSWLPTAYTSGDVVCIDVSKMGTFRDLAFHMGAGQPTQASLQSFEKEFGSLATTDVDRDAPLKHPSISPLYRKFDQLRGRLPPALFLCGTADPLLDDSILMSAHWQMNGGPATIKFVTGAPHAFIEVPIESGDCCVWGSRIIAEFLEPNSI